MELYEYLPENLELEDKVLTDLTALTINKYRKIKRKNTAKRLATLAASIAIIIAVMWAIGFENVAAAAQRLFSFIPGFGIIENEENIYILKDTVTIENENVGVTIYHASSLGYADTESLYFNLGIELNNSETFAIYDTLYNMEAKIIVGDKEFFNEHYTNKGNFTMYENVMSINGLRVDIPFKELAPNKKYELVLISDKFTVSIPFKLKASQGSEYIHHTSCEYEGTTVTAVKYIQEIEGVEYIAVDLIAKGLDNIYYKLPNFQLSEFEQVYFEGDGNVITPQKNIGDTYYFEKSKIKENYVLKLKNIHCTEQIEEVSFTVKVPKEGEVLAVNAEIPFNLGKFILKEAYVSSGKLFTTVESEFSADLIHIIPIITRDEKDIVSPMNRNLNFTDSNFNEMSVNIKETDSEITFNAVSVTYTLNKTFEFNFG